MKAAFTLPNFFVFQSFTLWVSSTITNNLRILKRILLLSPLCRRKIMVSCLEWNSRTFAFLPPFRAMEEGGRRVTVASRTRSTTFDRECLLRAASIMERKRERGRENERKGEDEVGSFGEGKVRKERNSEDRDTKKSLYSPRNIRDLQRGLTEDTRA